MVECPSCARLLEPRLICPECKTPLAFNLDCFAALGLPRKLQIDLAMLESSYHNLGRALHPDRFANASPQVRDASLRATALLTRSYRTLRDPATRAAYWLELHGYKLAENNQRVPPVLAGLVFEAQEELAELRDPDGAVGHDAATARTRVQTRQVEVKGLLDQSSGALDRIFKALDAAEAGAAPPAELVMRLKATLAEGAYLATLMRDLRKALDSRTAA
jgi:molecular chaperone HscB